LKKQKMTPKMFISLYM